MPSNQHEAMLLRIPLCRLHVFGFLYAASLAYGASQPFSRKMVNSFAVYGVLHNSMTTSTLPLSFPPFRGLLPCIFYFYSPPFSPALEVNRFWQTLPNHFCWASWAFHVNRFLYIRLMYTPIFNDRALDHAIVY